jgi:hypothetical protein
MKKTIALSAVLVLGILGAACPGETNTNNANKANNAANMANNAANMANTAGNMANNAVNVANNAIKEANKALNATTNKPANNTKP